MACSCGKVAGETSPAKTYNIAHPDAISDRDMTLKVVGARETILIEDFDKTLKSGKLSTLPNYVVEDLLRQGVPIWVR